jgi:hypothetical protein
MLAFNFNLMLIFDPSFSGYVDEAIPEREPSATSNRSLTSQTGKSGRLELEPISKPKKTNVLKKMNSRGSDNNSKPSSSKSNSSAGSRRKKS